jgi:hypothetical protein
MGDAGERAMNDTDRAARSGSSPAGSITHGRLRLARVRIAAGRPGPVPRPCAGGSEVGPDVHVRRGRVWVKA